MANMYCQAKTLRALGLRVASNFKPWIISLLCAELAKGVHHIAQPAGLEGA